MFSEKNSRSDEYQTKLDEVLAELMRAIDAGAAIEAGEWLTRYPEFANELREFFAKNERLEKLVRPLRQAAANVLHVRCPHCHNPIELLDQAPLSDISCPSCGSSFSLIGDNTLSHDPRTKSFGHFELLDRVGIGQFGSVWKARDTKLDRTVAIKIPRNGRMDSTQTEMFLRDARAAAQLKHPNIVSVHEVGKQDDTVYIVSDFVQGATLKEWTDAKRLTPRETAELCIKIAKALHHAHEAGVIHRDLKPSNIMMDTDGEPHLVDFGLAKREAGEITMTVEGQILGTPAYMSPEQARGEGFKADRRADIYSLGVILFELLTGELPFRGDKQMLLVQIIEDEPPSPRKLNSSVPRDLETICLKCLAKEPAKRYECGLSLAHDLERFLFGEPIQARPVGRLERTVRWAQRHPQVASLLGLTVMLLVAVAGVTTWGYFREAELRGSLEQSYGSLQDEQRVTAQLNLDVQQLERRRAELSTVLDTGRQQLDKGQRELYDTYLQLARHAQQAEDIERADYHLNQCPERLRKATWFDLKRQVFPPLQTFDGTKCVAISDDGQLLAAAGAENSVKVWNLRTGELVHTMQGHDGEVVAVDFSPNGKMLASAAGQQVILWDVGDGLLERTLGGHPAPVTDIEFSPDGKTLASASYSIQMALGDPVGRREPPVRKGNVVLWDLSTFESESLPGVRFVVFNHDGQYLATKRFTQPASRSEELVVWDLAADASNREPTAAVISPGSSIRPAFHPTRNELAVPGGTSIAFWDVESEQVTRQLTGDIGVTCLAYSRDGSRLVFAGTTNERSSRPETFRTVTWNLVTSEKEQILPWYSSHATGASYSPNGKQLATADAQTVKVWDVTQPPDPTKAILDVIAEMNVGEHDWPGWGGSPARINTPTGRNIPTSWNIGALDRRTGEWISDEAKNIKWVARLGNQTYGNPVVANGRIFVGTNNGAGYLKRYPPNIDLGVLLCFDEATGVFLWQHSNEKLPSGYVHDWPLQGVCSTPVIDGNRIWYVSNRGEVVCLDTEGFHDGEDDGPDKAAPARIFDLMRNENSNADKVAPAVELLNKGTLPLSLREGLASRGLGFPEEVQVETVDEGKTWTMTAKIGDAKRQFSVMITEPFGRERYARLSVFKKITTEDLDEADVVWRFNMMEELGISQHNMANCSMLTVDGMLFVCTSNGVDKTHINLPAPDAPSFMAMDRDTGEVLWTDNSPGENILHAQWASPSYGVFDGQPQVIFPGGDGWVYSFDPAGDGKGGSKLLWKFDGNAKTSKWVIGGRGTRDNIIAFPAIYDGLVYIVMGHDPDHGEGPGHLWCIDPTKRTDGSDVSAELAVNMDGQVISHRRIQAVDLSRGERAVINPDSAVVWHYSHEDLNGNGEIDFEEEFHRSLGTPVIKDDILYVPDFSGLFLCLNAKTGKLYWTYDMLAACWGSALLVDGKVYVGDEDGDINVFRHSSDPRVAMKQVASGEMVPINADGVGNVTNMGDVILMTPIVANNVLYIATRSYLWAIHDTGESRPLVTKEN